MATTRGVVYGLHLPENAFGNSTPFEWIGRQALPRPGEQRAWALRLPMGIDFEQLQVDVFTFDHRRASAAKLRHKFQGGNALFPPDVIAKVAQRVRSISSVPRNIVASVLSSYGCARNALELALRDADERLRERGISMVDRHPVSLSRAEHEQARAAVRRLKTDFSGVVRAVRMSSPQETSQEPNLYSLNIVSSASGVTGLTK